MQFVRDKVKMLQTFSPLACIMCCGGGICGGGDMCDGVDDGIGGGCMACCCCCRCGGGPPFIPNAAGMMLALSLAFLSHCSLSP